MKVLTFLLLSACCCSVVLAANVPFEFSKAGYWDVPGSPRVVRSMNPGWEFSLDNFKSAKPVCLPHGIDEGEIGFEASGGVNRQQAAWYRKTFDWQGGSARQFLHFEAIMGKSRVTLNGRQVAAVGMGMLLKGEQ